MLHLHQLLPGDESQKCPLLPCSCFYWLVTVSQLTHFSNCSAYNILARTVQKTLFLLLFNYCLVDHAENNIRLLLFAGHYLATAAV
jgi:hypothetical protein